MKMSETENKVKDKKWTEAERLELATKLDNELDDFIQSLEKKSYTEGWPEDRWEEEMEKHPFFMQKLPEPGEELSPLMQGLQNLKYGEEDNTPEELAKNYKEDGNWNYKYKKFRLAILSYTEGIKTKCNDNDLMSQLYHNRATANFMLKNYRSCLNDCKLAMKLNPDYQKAWNKAITCTLKIKDYVLCIELCNKYLSKWSNDENVRKTLSEAIINQRRHMRDQRKQDVVERKIEKEENKLINAIESRNIKMISIGGKRNLSLEDLDPKIPHLAQNRVHLDKDNKLVWPVIICYPESHQTDFIQNFYEDTILLEQLQELYLESPPWDTKGVYKIENINVYFEDFNKTTLHQVNVNKTLLEILQHDRYIVTAGTPSFIILVANTEAEKRFLSNYHVNRI